jgi:hypothetical protein
MVYKNTIIKVCPQRKQFLLLPILIFLSSSLAAQESELNRPDHDNLPYYFGITIAYNSSTLHPTKNAQFLQQDSILSVEPGSSGGLALGMLATLRVSNHFELRANPQLIVGGSKYFTYDLSTPLPTESFVEVKTLPSTIVDFPFQVKFNSDRIHNFRVYMMSGMKFDIDLASNSAARNAQDLVKLEKYDVGYELGIGFNFYLKFVTLSPELKLSNGLSNIHDYDPNLKYSNILDKLQSRMIVFSINLEE